MSQFLDDAVHAWQSESDGVASTGPHDNIIELGKRIRDSDGQDRLNRANDALTLYHGSGRYSFTSAPNNYTHADLEATGYNVIRACTDTLTNVIARNKVRPLFVTENGDSKLKEKALGMQRAVESEFMRSKLWGELGVQVCLHGNMFDGGGVKIIPDYANHRVETTLIYAHEFLVSPFEAQRGDPRQGWHVQPVAREQLLAQFADDEKATAAIHAANRVTSYSPGTMSYSDTDNIADMVEVWEYWHLPSTYIDLKENASWGKNEDGERDPDVDCGHDGRHCICIEGHTLLDEPWVYEYFPIAWYRPCHTAVGFWSTGLPERLAPAQIELNYLNDRIRKIIHLHAVPRLVVWDQAKINEAKLTNNTADIITSRVQPSQAIQPLTLAAVPSELFARQEMLIRWAEKETGLSEMSISAQKPAGVDHAPGMQMLAETESIRQTLPFRSWEDFFVMAARIHVDCFRLLAEFDPKFSVTFDDCKQLKHIKWTDVDIESSRWNLRCWPTNLLPQTPAARKSFVLDMYNAKLWTAAQTLTALDFPDVESISGDTTAAQENIERMLSDAIAGEAVTPEPYMNLEMARTMIVSRINRLEADREDPEVIDRVRQLWEDTNTLLQKAMPPALPPPGMPPGAPAPPGLPPGP